MSDLTRILAAAGAGDPRAAGELLPLVYDEIAEHDLVGDEHVEPR